MRLQGKVAVVTGAGYGNGRGIAIRFAEEGAALVVADINEKTAGETAAMIAELGQRAIVVKMDVSKKSDMDSTIERCVAEFGRLDIMVNNAGVITGTFTGDNLDAANLGGAEMPLFLALSESDWDRVIDINLKGTFLGAQAAARQMIQAGQGGKIINFTSMFADVCDHGVSDYCASKAAIRMLTKCLALELARYKINVNAIAPGTIETAINRDYLSNAANREKNLEMIPWGRFGEPRDVANLALYLASDESDYMTGSSVLIDAGYTLR